MSADMEEVVLAALELRALNGGHKHHSECIHNLPPEEQIDLRGWSTEKWLKIIGPLPVQITPDDWEIEAPHLLDRISRDSGNG